MFFWWLARKQRKPVIIHISGNILISSMSRKYGFLLKPFVRLGSLILHLLTKWMRRYGVTFVAGMELQNLYSTFRYPAYQMDDVLFSEKELVSSVAIKSNPENSFRRQI